jgi:hypothetical protein
MCQTVKVASAVDVVVGLGSIHAFLRALRSAKQGRHTFILGLNSRPPISPSLHLWDTTGVSILFCLNSGRLYRSPREHVRSEVPTFAIRLTDQPPTARP